MSLTVTNVADNPQQPSISAEAYIPDQLIAGNLKLVTDSVTITGGAALKRGSVLGRVTLGASSSAAKAGGNTGVGTFALDGTTPVRAKAKPGVYQLRVVAVGRAALKDPDGLSLGEYDFSAGGAVTIDDAIKGVLTDDGTTHFAAGDGFDIIIAAGAGGYKLAASAAIDGSQNPVAILADDADASGGDVTGAIYLMGEFNTNALTLGSGITAAAAKAAMAPLGIFLKSAVSAADPS